MHKPSVGMVQGTLLWKEQITKKVQKKEEVLIEPVCGVLLLNIRQEFVHLSNWNILIGQQMCFSVMWIKTKLKCTNSSQICFLCEHDGM